MGSCSSTDNVVGVKYAELVGPETVGQTKALRNIKYLNSLLTGPGDNVHTIFDSISAGFNKYPENKHLGTYIDGQYVWKTYREISDLAKNFGSGLAALNLCPAEKHDKYKLAFLGLYSKNREEWCIADFSCVLYNIVSVPFYDTLGEDSIKLILEQTRMKTLLLSKDKVESTLAIKREGHAEHLEYLVVMERIDDEDRAVAREAGITLYDFQDILAHGIRTPAEYIKAKPDDIFTITYTSGTTGNSKGVITTHLNLISNIASALEIFCPNETDTHISYLPLAHIYERYLLHACTFKGSAIGFYRGDPLKLKDDLALLRPTIFAAVPRVLNRFYDLINSNLSKQTGLKAKLIKKAIKKKLQNLRTTGAVTHGFYDGIIFKKVKNMLGGRIRISSTASAPISAEVLDFMKIVFCAPIMEAYGQTETTGPVSATIAADPETGHVGGPIGCVEIKLVDIPEMNYTTEYVDENMRRFPAGEICLRGPCITPGYFKLKEITRETIDDEGWLHSGDVGIFRPNGSIKIIDRKKNIFKLAQGEYVAPEKIENILITSKYIAWVFVHGDSLQSFLVGVIVPERTEIEAWAKDNHISGSWEELCENPKVIELIQNDVLKISKECRLTGFETVRKLYLYHTVLTPDSGILTPTFKIKRHDARQFFREVIDHLYSQ